MGMYSILVVPNDHLHSIREDAAFGEKVYGAVSQWPFYGDRYDPMRGLGRVISIGHADHEQIVTVRHGRGEVLPLDEQEALFRYRRKKELAERRASRIRCARCGSRAAQTTCIEGSGPFYCVNTTGCMRRLMMRPAAEVPNGTQEIHGCEETALVEGATEVPDATS
jgi:hypothetical protein